MSSPEKEKPTGRRLIRIAGAGLCMVVLALAAAIAVVYEPDRPVAALAPRWAPPPSTFIEIAGMNVHLRDEGPRNGRLPLVLLHGTSASLHTWQGWAEIFRNERRVIRFDLPGFGLTGPSPGGDYRMPAYTAFVQAVLQRLDVPGCILAGNSFGGRVAWQTALAAPGRVRALVLVDASGYPLDDHDMPIGFRVAMTPGLNRIMENILPRAMVAASLKDVYGDPNRVDNALVDRYFELTLRKGNRRALVERFKQAPPGPGAERIRLLRVPTLIIWGGRDRLIPPDHARRFHRDIQGSRLVVFDDLGHVPHEEDPAGTAKAVRVFINDLTVRKT